MILDYEKLTQLTQNDPERQKQFIQGLRAMDSTLDFSKFEGLDDVEIYKKIEAEQPQIYLKNPDKSRQMAMDKAYYSSENPINYAARNLLPEAFLTQKQKEQNERDTITEQEFYKAARYNTPYQDLHPQIQKTYTQKEYNQELKNQELATKTIQELTQEDKEFIKAETGLWDSFFNDDDENIKNYMEANHAKEVVTPQTKKALDLLKNIHASHDVMSLAGGLVGLKDEKLIKDYMDSLETIMQNLGFAGVGTDKKGEIYVFDQKGRAYQVKSGFVESLTTGLVGNAGSIAGSIAGSSLGYKFAQGLGAAGRVAGAAPTPYTKAAGIGLTTLGTILGGAVGSATGSLSDTILTNAYLNRENTAPEMIRHAISEGTLSMVADSVVMSLIKLWGKAKQIKPQTLKQTLKQVADTAIEYTPLLGFAKRTKDGNKAAAQKLIDHAIPQEAQADLKALESIFGAEVQIGTTKTNQAQSAISSLESKLGSDSYIVKGAKSLYDTFAFTSQKQAQKDFIRAIRADESGNLSAFLSEAANASPVIQKNLLDILHQTSQKLAQQLGRFDLPPSTIKDVFNNFEKGTKQSYTDAIEQILLKVYDESYTTTLAKDTPNIPSNLSSQEAARFNTDSLEGFKAKMEKSGVLLEDSAKFLRFVESTIYNPKGVTFETLNNAQKTLNAYYKQASDPNFRSFVKDAVNGFIKRDIQAGIEKIFAQNAPLYNDARTLFDTALSDYAKMKETLKLADSLKIRDRRRSYDQVAQSLSRFFLGQGDNIPNFEALLGGLQKELREQVELKLLQDMLELSFVKLNEIKVLDSSEFFKRLDPLKGYFASTSAKDFIKIAQDFHTLFRNDASIARSLSPATTEKIGTSIATTLEGAVKFQVIKAVFANIIRLMPHIPFAKGLNERVQGSALRYQLKKALDSSLSVGEFKLELQARSLKADFNNATREQIARILGQVDSDSLEKAITPTPPKQLDSSLKTSEIKQELLQHLEPILNKPLTNAQGVQAYINHASIDKMLSDKAIAKSVENGFSKQEHLEAVGDIERLFSISQEAATHSHKGDNPSVIIHRLNAPFKNANALITTKESLDKDKNRIYSVELELTPRFDTPARPTDTEASKGSSSSLNGQGGQDLPTIAKADKGNSTTLSPLEQAKAQKQAAQASQEAAQAAQAAKDEATAQAIKDRNDQIQHLKDSRAGKGEMEREVKLGQPIAMQRTEQPQTSIATDDNNIYQLDFVIVKASDVKPNFNADGLQPRTQKEHKTIESIARNFKPEMVLGRGGYKDLPIIAKDGQVITGNHRVQGFKDFSPESRAAYEKAIKERFNIELASDELLLRTPSDDLSIKELLSIAYNSNKEDIKNLGDHIYSVLGRYAPNFAKLPRQLESSSVQELKSKIARILDNSPYPNENDTNLALLANTIKADKNANITEMLNSFSKLDKEDADKTLSTFTDTAGLWHILSNNAVEYGLKQLDLRPYLLGAMYKSATSQHTTRAANFRELNEQIKHILDTTDSSGSNMMLEMMPNTYDNLIADLLGASLARFMRLENPSTNLYEALKGANSGIREQLAPRLDFETGFTTGKNIEQADIFDFIEYMIRQGEGGKEVNEAVELLPKLREKYNAFKASTTPKDTQAPKGLESSEQGAKTPQEISEILRSWDLSPNANASTKQRAIISQISKTEAQQLQKDFNFKGKKPLVREIDSHQVIHTLKQHGDEISEAQRGQEAIDFDDIANYEIITQKHDIRITQDNGKILYAKQVNGHFIVVEEVLEGQDKVRFFDMWKQKGKLNKEVLLSHSQRPNTSPSPSLESRMPSSTSNSTTKTFNQAQTPPREIPAQDLPHHAEKELYAELEALKSLKKELAQLKQSGEWRSKQGIARRKELDEKIKEAKARGIDTYKIANTNAKNYKKFLSKYGDMEYFRELAQKRRDEHIQGFEKRIKEFDDDRVLGEHGVVFTKQALINILEKTRGQELDIDMEIWRVATDMANLKDRGIKRQTEAQDRTDFNTKARERIQRALGIKPIAEFGENYAEYYRDGVGAIEKLLLERNGQVSGAFHRKELGDIDVVWGDSSFGLAHIIERRMQDFINQGMNHEQAEQAVKELLDKIPQILEGQIYKDSADKVEIITDKYTLVIGKRDERKFIITELIDRRNGKRMEAMQTRVGDSFTDEPLAKSPLSSNRSDSTTKTFNQADIKLESLSDFSKFARLAGFGDLSEQELERAHKHILENLNRIEC